MSHPTLMQQLTRPGGQLGRTLLLVLLLAAVACRAEATPTTIPTPEPTEETTRTPLPTPEPIALDFGDYWNPPMDYYGEPVYGGTLRVSYDHLLEHANVWGAASGAAHIFRLPTGATLVQENPYDPDGDLIPDLAESWSIHEGFDGVTFNFRDGAWWHNGELFYCEDARFSLETMATENGITASYMKHLLTDVVVDETGCLDDMTLEVNFKGPTADPLRLFSDHHAVIFNKAWFEEGGEDAMFEDVTMGIGPFQWAGDQTVGIDEQNFIRNPNYYIEQLPYLDELVIHGVWDEGTEQAAFLVNQIDWHWMRNWEQYQAYVDHDQIVTAIRTGRRSPRLWLDESLPPFGNARVRQAILMGINRRAAIHIFEYGHGTLGGFGLTPGSPWELSQRQICSVPGWCISENEDVIRDEARSILASEGFDFDREFTIPAGCSNKDKELTTFLEEQLRYIGVKVYRLDCECGLCMSDPYFRLSSPVLRADDPNAGIEVLLPCESWRDRSATNLCDASVASLLNQARIETDYGKRLELAHQIELSLMNHYNLFPIYWQQEAAAFWPKVRGYVHSPAQFGSHTKFLHMWIDPAHVEDSGNAGQTSGVPGGF